MRTEVLTKTEEENGIALKTFRSKIKAGPENYILYHFYSFINSFLLNNDVSYREGVCRIEETGRLHGMPTGAGRALQTVPHARRSVVFTCLFGDADKQ